MWLIVLVIFGFFWIINKSSDVGGFSGGLLALVVILVILAAMGFR